MIAKWFKLPLLLQILLLTVLLAVVPHVGWAQYDDDLGEDDFFGSEDGFEESDDDLFGGEEEDFTEGGEFIDESVLAPSDALITAQGRQSQLRLLGERDQLPINAGWGAGTGLLIGGWFALINNGTNRETQRSLGLGVVIGTILGITIGVRTLIVPNAPIPVSQATPHRWEDEINSLRPTASAQPYQFSYSLRF